VAAYKNLALVERAFRTLKGVDLQVRPVDHWLGHRADANRGVITNSPWTGREFGVHSTKLRVNGLNEAR
jgi:hypothetical protein